MRKAPSSKMSELLQPPDKFPFPFQPYGIQEEFMRALYETLEGGRVGIFESPTGTGKSLSLICGALRWLQDREQRDKENMEKALEVVPHNASGITPTPNEHSEPDWFRDYDVQRKQKEAQYKLKEELERKARQREKIKQMKLEMKKNWKPRDRVTDDGRKKEGEEEKRDEEDVILEEYYSDDETTVHDESDGEEKYEEEDVLKIYYCSRTHSQLAQFVKEVQKSPYGSITQVVTLGSRQNLCINEEVKRLKNVTLINDRCLELQRNKKKCKDEKYGSDGKPRDKRKRRVSKAATCPFLKPASIENFKDMALAEVQDIEQLVGLGRHTGTCPYYGVRKAIPSAQLVVLPYNTLLHQSTREAVGLKLKGNVVIIDEAHNLLDVINSVHSVEITGSHVSKALSQLMQYKERYRTRLKAKNLMYVNQIIDILNCLAKAMSIDTKSREEEVELLRLNDFLFRSGLDNINLFKVMRYCDKSEIAKKLNGFVDRYFDPQPLNGSGRGWEVGVVSGDDKQQMRSPLVLIESFLSAMTSPDRDGRIVITKTGEVSSSRLKFLLLNPAAKFAPVLTECRAVIVAGGTMQPISEFKEQLLYSNGVSPSRVTEFSCGHVIPKDHLLPLSLSSGPAGVTFDFTFQKRDNTAMAVLAPMSLLDHMWPSLAHFLFSYPTRGGPITCAHWGAHEAQAHHSAMMDELGRTIVNLCNVIPGGVVCFLPSYDYEQKIFTHWTTTGCLDKINSKKKVFREPKMASQVEAVLAQYSRCIEFNRPRCEDEGRVGGGGGGGGRGLTGALLLSVVGGKLSEGINFSDDLGRCVVMVGLPYPNIKSPELMEKMSYLNSTLAKDSEGRLPGQVHYENLCMKAVNQSIGRSIRHARDYAAIVLVDHRYSRPSVHRKLPGWISSQLVISGRFGPAFSSLRKFFNDKKKKS